MPRKKKVEPTVRLTVSQAKAIQASLLRHNRTEAALRDRIRRLTQPTEAEVRRRIAEAARKAARDARHARFVLNHPTATWFSRVWSAHGRRLNRRKRELEIRVGEARERYANVHREYLRREGARLLVEAFRQWDDEEHVRARSEALAVFRMMSPSLTEDQFDALLAQRKIRPQDMPVEPQEDDAET